MNPLNKSLAVVTALLFAMSPAIQSQTVNHVYSFTSQGSSQGPHQVTPTQGRDGRLYGTTEGSSYGSIFRLSTAGSFTDLFAFSFTNGCCPAGNVTLASDGNLYGTAFGGGNGQ